MSTRGKQLKKKLTSVKVSCVSDLRGRMKIVYVVQEGVGRGKEQSHVETYALRRYLKNKACCRERETSVLHTGRPPIVQRARGRRQRRTQTRSDIMSCQDDMLRPCVCIPFSGGLMRTLPSGKSRMSKLAALVFSQFCKNCKAFPNSS